MKPSATVRSHRLQASLRHFRSNGSRTYVGSRQGRVQQGEMAERDLENEIRQLHRQESLYGTEIPLRQQVFLCLETVAPVGTSVFEGPHRLSRSYQTYKLPPLPPNVATPIGTDAAKPKHRMRLTFGPVLHTTFPGKSHSSMTQNTQSLQKHTSFHPFLLSFWHATFAVFSSAGLECCKAECTVRDDDNGEARGTEEVVSRGTDAFYRSMGRIRPFAQTGDLNIVVTVQQA
jgi:hypothetical protein